MDCDGLYLALKIVLFPQSAFFPESLSFLALDVLRVHGYVLWLGFCR